MPAVFVLACAPSMHAALAVERVAVHQFEDGPLFGDGHTYLPGETVYFSCRLTGYQVAGSAEETRTVKLSWNLHVTDPAGLLLVPEGSGRIDAPVFSQDKNWRPKFLYSFEIPPFAPGGKYRIATTVRDEVGASQVDAQLTLTIRGRDVQPSSELVARNLHFQRTETDATVLDPPVYHPGETLWARFDITGFKYGEKNRYSVEYGLAILRENGEQVFAQPAAANDAHESFYPQHYVPGSISLNLDPMVPEGTYILVITMRDQIGSQSAEARAPFRIGH